MERNSHALDESHSFIDTNNLTIFPNYTLNKDSNDNLASNHQNCETSSNVAPLKQISQMLLGENIDENINVFPEEAALKAVEKSFYDILREKYPPSPNKLPFSNLSQETPSYADQYSQNASLPIIEFRRGMEEGMKLLPNISNNSSLIHLPGKKAQFPSKTRKGGDLVGSKLQGDKDEECDYVRSTRKRHANCEELSYFGGRKCKISVLYFKDPALGEIFNKVLLLQRDNYKREVISLRETMERERKFHNNEEIHRDSVDLRSLLIHCSHAIATNDHKTANELINQIKKHSSLDGSGVQRMAYIFAVGLEVRLAGTIDESYNQIVDRRVNHVDMLNAYHIVQIGSPFVTAADYFAQITIFNAAAKASKLHIIHLGSDFGYKWPRLMQDLSERKGMSPNLRITCIDVPELGFHNMEQSERVGRMLAAYARSFNIPFEYRVIGTKLEEFCIEDVNIEKDELVIVICFFCLENLGEEMDVMKSPRNQVLDIIRRINPYVFIQGVLNVSFSGAFFAPRFKQVLLHYSALFDLLETNVPRGNESRKLVENFLWGREAINMIACEGSKRTQRPETYKQWHVRNSRLGFEQLPLDRFVVKRIKEMGNNHNKNFFVEDDNEWLLLGWKGRTLSAVSVWRPKKK